jgi:four helix bundle protein
MDSVYLNVAEDNGQLYIKKEIQFLSVAIGSISEVKACLDLMLDRRYINEKTYKFIDDELREITKILFSIYKRLKEKLNSKNEDK